MDQGSELIDALHQISKEKGIDQQIIFEAIETSLVTACKKNFGTSANIKINMDHETGNVSVYAQKTVVDQISDSNLEINLESAKKMNARYDLGDIVDVVVTPRNFGRISAQTAKQVVVQKFREAEREILYNEYITKERDIVTGIVQRKDDRRNIVISLGKIEAMLAPSEQISREKYNFQDRIKVYVLEVKQTPKGPQISISRTHPELVKRLFEQEVPEVYDGVVEVRSITREAGSRTKMAVYSKNRNVDPVGACVGQNGHRVNVIVRELNGEKVDIIEWNQCPELYIAAALSPSRVLAVVINPADQTAKIVVPDYQLSLAIGKEGQNARMAAKLTGWRIDIKSESQARTMGFVPDNAYDNFERLLSGEALTEETKIKETEKEKAEIEVEVEEVKETETVKEGAE
ncbi:MAG: transcription termination factor NusA [Clostridiales bacterium]|jgi:N utilization substance protein A|nr:transcription termination factor NusA [Clostridiales bacterium]